VALAGAWLQGAPLMACEVWALDAPTPLIRRLGRMCAEQNLAMLGIQSWKSEEDITKI
jgi:hypothetical protein